MTLDRIIPDAVKSMVLISFWVLFANAIGGGVLPWLALGLPFGFWLWCAWQE